LPPKIGWKIRSWKDQSILFRFREEDSGGQINLQYQDFLTETVPNQTECHQVQVEQVEQPGTQIIQTKKNLLSQPLHMDLLWKDKSFADVTFVVENEEIQAHRIILLKCHYFQNMFNSIENKFS